MSTLPQLPGINQGLAGLPVNTAAGAAETSANTGDGGDPLSLFERLGLDPQDLPPQMQALLAQLFDSGMILPEGQAPDGKTPPDFAGLARALAAGLAGQAEAAPSQPDGQAPVGAPDEAGVMQAPLPTALPRSLQALFAGEGRQDFEALLQQAGGEGKGSADLPDTLKGLIQAMPPAAPPRAPMPTRDLLAMPVPQPVSDPAWGAAIGERLLWMARGDHQQAEIRISPPNLGPLEIRLNLNHDQASVSFVSHHALVRDALEAAIPRLREMLAEQQINLVQADVGTGQQHSGQAAGHQQAHAGGRAATGPAGTADAPAPGPAEAAQATARGLGLLDLFA